MVICSECGTRIEPKIIICPKCGAPVDSTNVGPPVVARRTTPRPLMVGGVLAAVVAAIVAYLFLR